MASPGHGLGVALSDGAPPRTDDLVGPTEGEPVRVHKPAHIRDHGLTVLPGQRPGVEVDTDRFARPQAVEAVTDSAPDVKKPCTSQR